MYNRQTGNAISELLYAAYDKTNDLIDGYLPLTNAEKANVKLYEYAKNNGYLLDISSHSLGGLTASVAQQYANTFLYEKPASLEQQSIISERVNKHLSDQKLLKVEMLKREESNK